MDSSIKAHGIKGRAALDPLYDYRAEILDKLKRTEEAERDRQTANRIRGKRERLATQLKKPPERTSRSSPGRPVVAWNVVGPFPMDPKALGGLGPYVRIVQPDNIQIPEFWHERLPPEEKIDFDATYAGKAGAKAGWRPVEADKNGLVDLSALYPEIDFAIACAAAYVFSEHDATYTVRVGCDDLMTVRANGKKIHTFCGPGHASRGQKTLQVPLKSDWNEIVLKTANVTHDWGFYFEFVDHEETLRFALRPKRPPDL